MAGGQQGEVTAPGRAGRLGPWLVAAVAGAASEAAATAGIRAVARRATTGMGSQ